MGRGKGLLPFPPNQDKTLLRYQIESWHNQFMNFPIYIVLGGPHQDAYQKEIQHFPSHFFREIINSHPHLGPMSSVQESLKYQHEKNTKISGSFILPLDTPLDPHLKISLEKAYEQDKNLFDSILYCSHQDTPQRHGHPVFIPQSLFPNLLALKSKAPEYRLDYQLAKYGHLHKNITLLHDDKLIYLNLNSSEDYDLLKKK